MRNEHTHWGERSAHLLYQVCKVENRGLGVEFCAKYNVPYSTFDNWTRTGIPADQIPSLFEFTKDWRFLELVRPDGIHFVATDEKHHALEKDFHVLINEDFQAVAKLLDKWQKFMADDRLSEKERLTLNALIDQSITRLEEDRQAVNTKAGEC